MPICRWHLQQFKAGAANANYYCSGFVRNCIVEGLDNRVSGEGTTCAGINHWLGYKTGFTISGNTVRNLSCTANELGGIICSPETPAMMTGSLQRVTITKNEIYDLVHEGAGQVDVIGVEVSGRSPLVTFNRIYGLQSPNTTTSERFWCYKIQVYRWPASRKIFLATRAIPPRPTLAPANLPPSLAPTRKTYYNPV